MSLPLVGALALAGVAAALLTGAALAVFLRRRSRSHLLVALALGALLARTVVAGASLAGAVALDSHHLVEHSLDVVMAALVVAAVYYARSADAAGGGTR
ncbi:DUF7471 family protein [Halobacterium litoreum]|uniref:Uncharacterized protein n=1 Tax=Halobacterium litoreum TaxID=2039234 RepID=A0ABD5NIS4_9EURY|nr:hypothetical protein [Halobacterium litoreum]UHH12155.1 hypothetical protein LT972_08300 [Halobacterium litoreum]